MKSKIQTMVYIIITGVPGKIPFAIAGKESILSVAGFDR